MDRMMSPSQPSAQAPEPVSVASDLVLEILLVGIMAALAMGLGLLAAIVHGS